MKVAFIGSDYYTRTPYLAISMFDIFANLIAEGAEVFLFNNANSFCNDCLLVIDQMKMHHPNIKRHRNLRNRKMIDECDVLITYCSNEELHAE